MLDLSRSIRGLLEAAIEQARKAQQTQRYVEAANAWDEAARLSETIANSTRSDKEKSMRLRAAKEFREVAERLRKLPKQVAASAPGVGSVLGAGAVPGAASLPGDNATAAINDELSTAIQSFRHRSTVGWNKIAGLKQTVQKIQSAYALSVAKPPRGVELKSRHNLLFYGPPGCGKSLLAAAASNGLDAAFFNVPVSGLVSKWFGESAKLVSALYREARRLPISIIFLDEMDALARARDDQDSNASRQILANLLSELDGVATKDHSGVVITIAATNLPWDLDPAVLSRFSQRIYIPLPDREAREQMFNILLRDQGFELAEPMEQLVNATEGYSGREIQQICQSLVEHMLWNENPSLSELAQQGREALSRYTVSVRPISSDDVQAVLSCSSPQTSPDALTRFQNWGN